MPRPPIHERLWRQVLSDPDATNDQRLEAARKLEKAARQRRKFIKQAQAEESKPSQPAEGWVIADGEKPSETWLGWPPALRASWRALWASDSYEHHCEGYGGAFTAWESEQGKRIRAGELKPVGYSIENCDGKHSPIYTTAVKPAEGWRRGDVQKFSSGDFVPVFCPDPQCHLKTNGRGHWLTTYYAPVPEGTEVLQ